MGVTIMTEPKIVVDRMTKASETIKRFGEARKRAKEAPLFIIENGKDEVIIQDRIESLEKTPQIALSWKDIRRTE